MSFFDSFLEVAGNLGFLVGNNDRRRAQARKDKRSWGPEQDGFALSISASSLEPDTDESLRIDIAIRNAGPEPRELQVGGWLAFFSLEIMQPDGSEALLTTFGKRQMEVAESVALRPVILRPGEISEADIPVGALYEFKKRGVVTVRGKCRATHASSNKIEIRI